MTDINLNNEKKMSNAPSIETSHLSVVDSTTVSSSVSESVLDRKDSASEQGRAEVVYRECSQDLGM